MATTAVTGPPVAPQGVNGGNSHANSDAVNSAQQDPELHSTSQDPGSSHPQHPVFARPVFYVHAPSPAPFLHYQWPMPLPYSPFAGFPGMGYGMVMPPFPPPPYMEPPAYILPHPQVQPVDYRRLLHPQVHAPGAPHQNVNQTRRNRLPHTAAVRETVNSEVQTEPMHRGVAGYDVGCLLMGSDSGHATASNSPSSLSSSSQKQGSAQGENCMLPSNDPKEQGNGSSTSRVKHDCNMIHPTEITGAQKYSQTCKGSMVQEPPTCRNAHCNMWSVSSQDSMDPVCSSSQREDEAKERRISVPDILMSWGGGTPTTMKMVDKGLPGTNHEIPYEVEHEKSVCQSPAETNNDPVLVSSSDGDVDTEGTSSSKDSEMVLKILRLPSSLSEPFSLPARDGEPVELIEKTCLTNGDEMLQSLNASYKLSNDGENVSKTDLYEDTAEITPYYRSLSSCQMKRKMDESLWSVESQLPFIPTKEWLQQNGMFEPKVAEEMIQRTENGETSTKNDSIIVQSSKEKKQSHRISSSDSVPLSESCLTFSTPAKKPDMESESEFSEMRGIEQDKSIAPSEKDPSTSPLQRNTPTPAEEDVDENGSPKPEANQNSKQESLMVNEQDGKHLWSTEREETCLMVSAAEEKILSTPQMIPQNGEVEEDGAYRVDGQMRDVELCVPMTDQNLGQVSPAKGNLVDCGIQCSELQSFKCFCEELKNNTGQNRRHPHKYPDMKKADDGKAGAFCMNAHVQRNSKRNSQWRNKGQEKHNSQQDVCSGYGGKPGKSKGGNGRNLRY